jgi:hypothetical protein
MVNPEPSQRVRPPVEEDMLLRSTVAHQRTQLVARGQRTPVRHTAVDVTDASKKSDKFTPVSRIDAASLTPELSRPAKRVRLE